MADWFAKFIREQNGESVEIPDTKIPKSDADATGSLANTEQSTNKPEPTNNLENNVLEKRLKEMRLKWAKQKALPPYCIFSNVALEGLTTYLPTTKEALSSIKGLGSKKIEQYGDEILSIIEEFLEGNPMVSSVEIPQKDKKKKSKKATKIQQIEPEQEAEPEIEDDENIKHIKELIKNGSNVFITGSAGTGKSYILNRLKKEFNFEVTSTTGMAAVNVGGQTIHAWAGVGICNTPLQYAIQNILKKSNLAKRIKNTKILAIDEISMLDATTFDYINNVLKAIRASNEPFGGLQLLLFGDFFQLPPVEKNGGFAFESATWKELNLQTVLLQKIYRQEDSEFAEILNTIRQNNFDPKKLNALYSRNNLEIPQEKELLHIFATNEAADNYNRQKFNSLKDEIKTFNSEDILMKNEEPDKIINTRDEAEALSERKRATWEILDKYCKAPQKLELKKNCRVMLLKNIDFEDGLINGSCGVVKGFEDDAILVKFDNGILKGIKPFEFDYLKDGKVVARRVQYPLRFAYGITIHKSQGMTLDEVFIDCARIFEYGQAYVALSRVKSLNGLYLKSFTPQKIMAHPKIIDFYASLKA